jgi:hypothetical protein
MGSKVGRRVYHGCVAFQARMHSICPPHPRPDPGPPSTPHHLVHHVNDGFHVNGKGGEGGVVREASALADKLDALSHEAHLDLVAGSRRHQLNQ